MKITNLQLTRSFEAYAELMDQNLPVALAFSLAQGMNTLRTAYESFNGVQKKIVDTDALKDESGKPRTLPGNPNAILLTQTGQTKLQELHAITIDIPLERFSISMLGDIKMKPSSIFLLDWLITA